MTASSHARKIVQLAAEAAEAKGGAELIALDVSGPLPLTDAFLLVSGSVERNVIAIASEVEDQLNGSGIRTLRREGMAEGRWILLDFGDLVVHIFHEDDRMYYALERLWKDCPVLPLELPIHSAD